VPVVCCRGAAKCQHSITADSGAAANFDSKLLDIERNFILGASMRKIKVKYFLLGGVTVAPILAILLLSFRGVFDGPDVDYLVIENATKDVRCPDGATMEYGPWGKSGRMAKCQIAHGAFIASEHGHIVVKSEYIMGMPVSEEKVR
jgi:hypothetical protein